MKTVAIGVVNTVIVIAVLTGVYWIVPVNGEVNGSWVARLISGLVVVGALLAGQVQWVRRARRPMLRAAQGLITSVLAFLMVFSLTYVAMSAHTPHSFSVPLNKLDSLYFTVTTFATVGFGDITAVEEPARLVVTVQMLLDLALIAVTARLLFHTATGAVDRRRRDPQSSASTDTGDSTQSAT